MKVVSSAHSAQSLSYHISLKSLFQYICSVPIAIYVDNAVDLMFLLQFYERVFKRNKQLVSCDWTSQMSQSFAALQSEARGNMDRVCVRGCAGCLWPTGSEFPVFWIQDQVSQFSQRLLVLLNRKWAPSEGVWAKLSKNQAWQAGILACDGSQ